MDVQVQAQFVRGIERQHNGLVSIQHTLSQLQILEQEGGVPRVLLVNIFQNLLICVPK